METTADPAATGGDSMETTADPAATTDTEATGAAPAGTTAEPTTGAEPAAADPDEGGGEAPTQKLSRGDSAADGPGPNGDGQERKFAERRS